MLTHSAVFKIADGLDAEFTACHVRQAPTPTISLSIQAGELNFLAAVSVAHALAIAAAITRAAMIASTPSVEERKADA